MEDMKKMKGRRLLSFLLVASLLVASSYTGVTAQTSGVTEELLVSWSRSAEPQIVSDTADAAAWNGSGNVLGTVRIDKKDYQYKSYDDQYWILKRTDRDRYRFSKKVGSTPSKDEDYLESSISYAISGTVALNVPQARWDWSIAGAIETPVNDRENPNGVWDSGTSQQYYTGYTSGTDYMAATWELKTQKANAEKGNADLRRFTGTFTLPDDYNPTDTIVYRSVNQDSYKNINNGNIMPINDDIYIFCYPKGTPISNDPSSPYYFMNYFVFWSGTAQQYNKTFQGETSKKAIHGSAYGAMALTDGWYVEADPDSIGAALFQNGIIPRAGDEYVIDIFTDDYAGGGGMDKPQILISKNSNLRIVAEDDKYTATKLLPANLDILQNDKVFRRDESVTAAGMLADNFRSHGDTVLSGQNGRFTVTVKGESAGSLIVGSDGKGTFTPADGFTGVVQFEYRAKINDNGEWRTDDAVVTITVENADMSEMLYVNKTAQLLDWNNRLYQIDLSAWSDGSSTTTQTSIPADVVLVIDRSGSMKYDGGSPVATAYNTSTLDTKKTYAGYYEGSHIEIFYKNGAWRWDWYGESHNNDDDKVSSDASKIGNIYETRMSLLKKAAAEFINALPEGSSIAVTSFAGSSSHTANYASTAITGTAAQQQAVKDAAIAAVNGINPSGSTYLSGGLTEAIGQLDATGRNNVIIAFTDGENDSDDYYSAISTAKTAKAIAKLFTIGMGEANNGYLKLICSPTTVNDPIDYNRPCENLDTLAEELLQILDDTTIVGGFTGVTVTDTIDPRFVVVDKNGNPLKEGAAIGNGGVLHIAPDGSQSIVWRNQTVAYDENQTGKPTWSQSLYVKAKDAFVGGNNVPTNGAGSKVEAEGVSKDFPQPTVNVRISLVVGDDADTIFKGEEVPGTTLQAPDGGNAFCGMAPTGTFAYVWKDAQGNVLNGWNTATFPAGSGITPPADTQYTLTVTFIPHSSTAGDANSIMGGTVYNASNQRQNVLQDEGSYTITVLTGSLTIIKNLVGENTDVDTTTPFVFKIEQYDVAGNLVQTFYRTVYTDENKTGRITIEGLSQGRYVVTEQVDWAWRYKDAGGNTITGQTLGMQNDYTDHSITAVFNNTKDKDNWYGATDSVTNMFE